MDYFVDNIHESDDHDMERSMNIKFPLRTKVGARERIDFEDYPRTEMGVNRTSPLIRMAMPNDASDIERLAFSVSLGSPMAPTEKDALDKMGFLVSNFDARTYSQFIKKAEHFLLLYAGTELVGFLLAYGSEHIDPLKEELNMHIKNNFCDKFVLIKQICISSKIEHRREGYATLLYKELYARITHYYDHETDPRPIYAAIVKEPSNSASVGFHEYVGFVNIEEFVPALDGIPRYIFENSAPMVSLDNLTTYETRSEICPFYDSRAMMDPHCIGIGVTLYRVGAPDELGDFTANIRIVAKWRQEGIEKIYPRKDDGLSRTAINMKDHEAGPRTVIRLPRYDLNKDEVDQISSYAYIDKNDPHDVITWQQVLRGTFSGELRNVRNFPADLQELRFMFRIWDNDPNDRCRYFRQLHYVDNTAWPICTKRDVKSMSFTFLAPQAEIDIFKASRTSRYVLKIPVLREATYYLRTVAFPITVITSLSFASTSIEDFDDQVGFNASVLLTTVAYLFIAKDVTPESSEVTMLDVITYGGLLLNWSLIMIRFIVFSGRASENFKNLEKSISLGLCTFVSLVQVAFCIFLYVRYTNCYRSSVKLGSF
eukprot:CAMPEP_0204621486 /NCGR_PEP_ID=MMETSP0717-20131115/7176_1 /ASSEMBLY_ACC=CAM_ASM_000666 /TAXON_ID=230516 /ORGANISM="Chaetoceros curvisetus" /LENGTH=597 /DNA_ID=CAMNT_0051635895 /DNA_START=69 /DNA_END=1862 /DNA_ORIENTATION=+